MRVLVSPERYRVVVGRGGDTVYAGGDKIKAIFTFHSFVVEVEAAKLKRGETLVVQPGTPHAVTGEPVVEARVNHRMRAALYGVTFTDYNASAASAVGGTS